ncbi:MAG: lysophospholipid acyltransferase family protein [Myxococcota bacterium]
MAKGVLGNDPFQQGAASRETKLPVLAPSTAQPHAGSPELVGVVNDQALPHPASPDLLEVRTPDKPTAAEPNVNVSALAPPTASAPAWRQALDAAKGLARVLATGLGTAAGTEVDAYGRDATLLRNVSPLASFLFERYWRVQVEGAEHVPLGRAVLVANHSGALPFDGPVLSLALRRERPQLPQARWLVEDQVFYAPFLGLLVNRLGAVRASPENATRLLDESRPVIVFPEGIHGLSKPFQERYQLQRFGRGGYVKLALRTGAPIIPVAVVGAEESLPLFGKLPGGWLGLPYLPLTPLGPVPLPAKWIIRFGEPIDLGGLTSDAAEDLAEVQRLNDATREAVSSMLAALLQKRSSVF